VKAQLLGDIFDKKETNFKKRVEDIVSLSQIIGIRTLLISSDNIDVSEKIGIINYEKLSKDDITSLMLLKSF
jgi:hypothetical protein